MSSKARQNNPPSFRGKEGFMVYISDEMYDSLKKVVKYVLQNVSFTCTKLRRCEWCPPFHNSVIPTYPDCKSRNSHHWLGDLKTTFVVFSCIKWRFVLIDVSQKKKLRCHFDLRKIKWPSTILVIIFWHFLMFSQIFFSPQVKRSAIITNNYGIYDLQVALKNCRTTQDLES